MTHTPETSPRAMTTLRGTLAVVTGASRGIGRAVAARLANDGATVVMLARTMTTLSATASEIGGDTHPVPCDVSSVESIAQAVNTIRASHAVPDIIVNNAGLFRVQSVEHTTVAQFTDMMTVNLIAPFTLIRAFLPEMRVRGTGHIVSVGSIADRAVFPGNGAYAASKHGLRALHEVLRGEVRGTGLRTTLVSPGPVDTPLWDPIDPDHREGFT